MSRRLDLFGTIHFDRLSKVEAELTEYVEMAAADAVFVEWPIGAASRRALAAAAVRVPFVVLGGIVLELFRAPFYLLFNRRFDSTEHVALDALPSGIPVHPVDRPLWSVMADAGWRAIVASWLLLVGFLVLAPVQTAVTIVVTIAIGVVLRAFIQRNRTAAAVVGTLLFVAAVAGVSIVDPSTAVSLLLLAALPAVAAGRFIDTSNRILRVLPRLVVAAIMIGAVFAADLSVGPFVIAVFVAVSVFVQRTLNVRNRSMLDRVSAIADEAEYDTAVLVTGLGHVSGIGECADDYGVQVGRTYTPRWLRAPGEIDEGPTPDSADESEDSRDRRPVTPGSIRARAAASLVDFVAFLILLWIPGLGLAAVSEALFGGVLAGFLVGVFLTPIVYHAVFEAAFGWTVGKRLTHLVVTNADGSAASLRACMVRNLLRPLDFVLFYLVGVLAITLTERQQRLGDLAAKTEVRRAR